MPYDLERFVDAQRSSYEAALGELTAGTKDTHWMWFIFPQLRGLGSSAMAHRYGIASLEEARAYLAHPLLGGRLRACVDAVLGHPDRSVHAIFGSPDDLKFASSMTLFAAADRAPDSPFVFALNQFCAGRRDERTLALLK